MRGKKLHRIIRGERYKIQREFSTRAEAMKFADCLRGAYPRNKVRVIKEGKGDIVSYAVFATQ